MVGARAIGFSYVQNKRALYLTTDAHYAHMGHQPGGMNMATVTQSIAKMPLDKAQAELQRLTAKAATARNPMIKSALANAIRLLEIRIYAPQNYPLPIRSA
jgi:hypothetical protein